MRKCHKGTSHSQISFNTCYLNTSRQYLLKVLPHVPTKLIVVFNSSAVLVEKAYITKCMCVSVCVCVYIHG